MLLSLTEIFSNATTIYASLAVVLLTTLYYVWRSRGVPPGPVGLPYLGYTPFLNPQTCHLQLQKLGEKYGRLFSFRSAGRLYINLGSIKVMREALVTKADNFQQRLDEPNILHEHLNGGVLYAKGEPWKIVRKSMLQLFRERGMTAIKDTLAGPMYDTIRSLVTDLKSKKGEPVDISSILFLKSCSVMRQTLLGDDGMSDEELLEFNKAYFCIGKEAIGFNTLLSGIVFKYFFAPFSKGIKEAEEASHIAKSLLKKAIERRKSTYDETQVRDLIDGFIKERNVRKSKNDPTAKYFTDEMLLVSLLQFIGDGILTVAMFITTFIGALVEMPEVQEKMYQELVDVVGDDRDPSMEDKSKLAYTNAFLSECLRTTALFPYFPTVVCTKETTLNGYRIPTGSILLYNFWMAHMNPEDYEEPEKFNPSRFITEDRSKRPELPVLFGIGRRSCLGEGFSMTQFFLFVTTIVKNFRLTKPEKVEKVSSFVEPYYVCAQPRK